MKKVIAIIEDSDIDREMIESYFCTEETENHFIDDGEDALNYLDYNNPTIVILDINLPKVSGLEILKKIREINRECIVIIMTSSPNPSEIKDAYRNFANAYVVKPVDSNHYKKILTTASDFWFNVAKLAE